MRRPGFGFHWRAGGLGGRRLLAAIEATAVGLTLGLIDIHSTAGDWFNAELAYLIAGFVLGVRHGGRSWQAWCPLGWCFYLMHRVAIACGYRPPYVEVDAGSAILAFFVLWPAGLGLALGAFLRLVISGLLTPPGATQETTNHDPRLAADRDIAQPADSGRAPPRPSVPTSTGPVRRQRLTVGGLMVIVAWVGVYIATLRALLMSDQFFGFSTIYAQEFSESRFRNVRVGMSREEVEAIVGRPLRKVPWNQDSGPHDEEMWHYSDQRDDTANFHRRWVFFEKGKVVTVINDFWVD
jgi:hypothetical protein